MSASASSLFTNFRPFFVSRYEGREELYLPRDPGTSSSQQTEPVQSDCCACLAFRSQRHGGTTVPPEAVGFEKAILLVEDGVELEAGDVITE